MVQVPSKSRELKALRPHPQQHTRRASGVNCTVSREQPSSHNKPMQLFAQPPRSSQRPLCPAQTPPQAPTHLLQGVAILPVGQRVSRCSQSSPGVPEMAAPAQRCFINCARMPPHANAARVAGQRSTRALVTILECLNENAKVPLHSEMLNVQHTKSQAHWQVCTPAHCLRRDQARCAPVQNQCGSRVRSRG